MKRLLSIIILSLSLLLPFHLLAQADDVEMADLMHQNGKIYVVVTVVGVVLVGLFVFLMIIDKRLRKLEKSNRD